MVSTTLSFHSPTGVGHPSSTSSSCFGTYRYEVIFNLRFVAPPVSIPSKIPSSARPSPQTKPSHPLPLTNLDDGRRKREWSQISSSLSPESDENVDVVQWESSMTPSSLIKVPHLPGTSESTSSTPSYRSGYSHLAVECSVDILQLYSATLERLSNEYQSSRSGVRHTL